MGISRDLGGVDSWDMCDFMGMSRGVGGVDS